VADKALTGDVVWMLIQYAIAVRRTQKEAWVLAIPSPRERFEVDTYSQWPYRLRICI
jgi:hypothetical protein